MLSSKTPAHSKNPTSHTALNQGEATRHGAARQAPQPAARPLAAVTAASPQAAAQAQLANRVASSPRMVAQRRALRDALGSAMQLHGPGEEESLQGKSLQRMPEDEEPLQRQPAPPVNRTGMPDGLKAGIESLSGMSLDHVRVHYNSSQPAQLNAHAYAQGPIFMWCRGRNSTCRMRRGMWCSRRREE